MPFFGSNKRNNDVSSATTRGIVMNNDSIGRNQGGIPNNGFGTSDASSSEDNYGLTGQPGLGMRQEANGPYTTSRGGAYDQTAYNQYGGGLGTNEIPPPAALNSASAGRGHCSTATAKAERTIGKVIGSSNLQARGLQKEQEARASKLQGAELAEAERLEREAMQRRERAVAHGAHPDNRHLGAGLGADGGAYDSGNRSI